MNMQFHYAASVIILLCSAFGLAANAMAFKRFAVSAVRPLLGWTIIAQFLICMTLFVKEARDLAFDLATRGVISQAWHPSLYPWPFVMLIAKVALAASVVFSATMLLGLLLRREEPNIRRAAVCSVVWTFVGWAALAAAFW